MLLVAIDRVDFLPNDFNSRIATCYFNRLRLIQQAIGEGFDLIRKRCREQQILSLRRQGCQHFADIANEAHIEHTVGFIKHEDLDRRKIERTLLHQIEQSTRCRHQNIDAT